MQEKYLEALPDDVRDSLTKTFENLDLEAFLQHLFEAMILELTVKKDESDEDYAENTNYP